jgi:hypothetical protein
MMRLCRRRTCHSIPDPLADVYRLIRVAADLPEVEVALGDLRGMTTNTGSMNWSGPQSGQL